MITFTEILGCDGTAVYQSVDQSLSFKTSGRLQVLLAYDGMLMLRLDDFQCGINSGQEIIYDTSDPQFQMVLYLKRYPSGRWVVKINEHTDEVYSCLNQKCYLKAKSSSLSNYSSQSFQSQKTEKSKQTKTKKETKPKKQKEEKKYYNLNDDDEGGEKVEQHNDSKVTVGSVIVTASKGLGWGLALTGKALSKGFEAIGSLASKAVEPAAEKVELSENAKANIDLAKKSSKSVLSFTATQVSNIFNFGKQTVSNIGERFEKSEKGKQVQENPKYETIKSGASTGVKVFSNIYDGIVTGVYEIGGGISKGTSKIIGKKYGQDAGQAADDLFEGAGNIVKITRVPVDQAAKTFKQ